MSDVRWEPVGNNERIPAVGRIAAMLPDGYALCRAVPAPTWSQEPPTEPGDWWMWRNGYRRPVLVALWHHDDMPGHWMMRRDGIERAIRAAAMVGYSWLPATVPPPPRT